MLVKQSFEIQQISICFGKICNKRALNFAFYLFNGKPLIFQFLLQGNISLIIYWETLRFIRNRRLNTAVPNKYTS